MEKTLADVRDKQKAAPKHAAMALGMKCDTVSDNSKLCLTWQPAGGEGTGYSRQNTLE